MFSDKLKAYDNEIYVIEVSCPSCGKHISFRYIPQHQTPQPCKTHHTQIIHMILLMGESM